MSTSFKNKTIVITGASRGIGLLLTQRFAAQGANVVFGARREAPLKKVENDLKKNGYNAMAVPCDIGTDNGCKTLIEAALNTFGAIDVLVNNAGISGVQKPGWTVTPGELDEVLQVNVHGALSCIRYAAPSMIKQQSGAIINIGSFTGKRPAVNRLAYATSKMALVGLTRTVALELAEHKIRCNVISPGPVEGERVNEVVANASRAQNISPEEVRRNFTSWMPLKEMVTEEEICDMVFFLASPSGRHMTGQDINMDSGIVMF